MSFSMQESLPVFTELVLIEWMLHSECVANLQFLVHQIRTGDPFFLFLLVCSVIKMHLRLQISYSKKQKAELKEGAI